MPRKLMPLKRSGYIVGGHQRIAIIDSLMGTDDYTLHVAAIDVDAGRERELNVLLNNSMAQGQWDLGLLDDLLKDVNVNIEGTGFDLSDVYQLLGTSPFKQRKEDAAKMAEQLARVSRLYDTIRDRNRAKEIAEFYLVFVFRSENGSVALATDERGFGGNECQFIKLDGFSLPMHKTGRQKTARYRLPAEADLCESCASTRCRPRRIWRRKMT